MEINLNGASVNVADDISVASLLSDYLLDDKRIIVVVNQIVIPQSLRADCVLGKGDEVLTIHAIGGS